MTRWTTTAISFHGGDPLTAEARAHSPAATMEGVEPVAVTVEQLQAAHIERQEEWCPDQKPDLSFRGNEMAGEVGEACNVIKKLERERHGWRGSRATLDDLASELADVVHTAVLCAITAGIDLGPAIVAKFNATSVKNGLASRILSALVPAPSSPTLEATAPAVSEADGLVERLSHLVILDEVGSDNPLAREAATAITQLRERVAQIDTERANWKRWTEEAEAKVLALEQRNVETQMLAHKWMEAHDKLHAGKPYSFPSTADLPASEAKVLALRALLQDIREGFTDDEVLGPDIWQRLIALSPDEERSDG